MSYSEIDKGPLRKIIKLNLSQKKDLAKAINHIIESNNFALDCKDITLLVNQLLKTNYPYLLCEKILKNEQNYSYKRVKSRPNTFVIVRIVSLYELLDLQLLP